MTTSGHDCPSADNSRLPSRIRYNKEVSL